MTLSICRSEDIFLENLDIDVSSIIKKALDKIEYGDHKTAFVLLEPLLKKKKPRQSIIHLVLVCQMNL